MGEYNRFSKKLLNNPELLKKAKGEVESKLIGLKDFLEGIWVLQSQLSSLKFFYEAFVNRGKGVNIPKNVIKDTESFIEDAIKTDRNGLSKVVRGLQKHSSRNGSSFKDIKFSHKDADKVGERVLKDILNSKNQKITIEKNNTKTIYDLATGRGVNISRDGLFNGFRDLNT